MRFISALLALSLALPAAGCAAIAKSKAANAQAAPQAQAAKRQVSLPQPVRITLPNGLTLLVIQRTNLPIVSVSVVARAGDVKDPVGKAGVASLTADLLTKGTKTRTAPQIAEAIDFVGGSLTSGSGSDTASVNLSVLKKDLGLGFSLLADVLSNPTFSPDEVKRLKDQYAASLKSSLDDANEVVRIAFRQSVLTGNPYGREVSLSSLKGITPADVRKFYQENYRPSNMLVAIVGDITPDEARTRVMSALGAWPARGGVAAKTQAPPPSARKRVRVVDMDVNQSFIMLGNMAVQRNHPDYFPVTVMNFILGGDFTSRLNQSIRDRQGLAYGASSRFQMFESAGYFAASLNTKGETTAQALTSLLQETRAIQETPVTAQELQIAKDYLTGSFPLRFETNQDLAREIVNIEIFGLPADYLTTYRDRVLAVSTADVQRVARQYLHPGGYDLVVVTKAKNVTEALKQFGPVEALPKEKLIQ